jgi:hypothetical protein
MSPNKENIPKHPKIQKFLSAVKKTFTNIKHTSPSLYLNLFQFATGDNNHNSGLEIQFLIDTGATCSLINYPTYEAILKLQPDLETITAPRALHAADTFDLKAHGIALIKSSYDMKNKHQVYHKAWITGKGIKTQNILGMDFIKENVEVINVKNGILALKGEELRTLNLISERDKKNSTLR